MFVPTPQVHAQHLHPRVPLLRLLHHRDLRGDFPGGGRHLAEAPEPAAVPRVDALLRPVAAGVHQEPGVGRLVSRCRLLSPVIASVSSLHCSMPPLLFSPDSVPVIAPESSLHILFQEQTSFACHLCVSLITVVMLLLWGVLSKRFTAYARTFSPAATSGSCCPSSCWRRVCFLARSSPSPGRNLRSSGLRI